MKKLLLFLSMVFMVGQLAVNAQCCNNPTPGCGGMKSAGKQVKQTGDVQVYYFHATRRCATCNAVENVTKETLKEYYGDKVSFESINREEDKTNPLIEKHKISGQTLLIIKGDKALNLTNEAFLNARNNPDKLKAKLKESIDKLMD